MAEINVYVDPDAIGSGSGVDWTNAYVSLSAAEAAEQTDLVSDGDNIIFHCRASSGTADTTAVSISGWTTDETHNITVVGDLDSGIWDTDKYVMRSTDHFQNVIEIDEDYTVIENIQIDVNNFASHGILVSAIPDNSLMDKCIVANSTHSSSRGIRIAGGGIVQNTILYGLSGSGIEFNTFTKSYSQNNTIYNCGSGIKQTAGSTAHEVINSVVFNNTDDIIGTVAITYSCGDDSDFTSGTGNFQITQTASDYAALVTDAPNGDFSVTDDSSELYNAGTNTGAPSDDIIGTSRPQSTTVDIGAFELIVGGGLTLDLDDTVSMSEALTKAFGMPEADTVTMSDDINTEAAFILALNDTVAMTDGFNSTVAFILALSDTVNMTDDFKNDTITMSDDFNSAIALVLALNDTINMSDDFNSIIALILALNDTITISDDLASKEIGLSKSDTINSTDNLSYISEFIRSISDTVNISDAISKGFETSFADTINMTDNFSALVALILALNDSISMSDSLTSKEIGLNKDDIISLSDEIIKSFGLTKSDIINISDAFSTDADIIAALLDFIAKNRNFNFNAKNKTFNFNAKSRGNN